MNAEKSPDGAVSADERQRVWEEAREHFGRQALIEQTKGMLMLAYGLDADEAFDVLRSQSQRRNVKLRVVAEELLNGVLELGRVKRPVRPAAFDGVLQNALRHVTGAGPEECPA